MFSDLAEVTRAYESRQAELHAGGFDGYVYDLTVAHDDHNFIANGFVVSVTWKFISRSSPSILPPSLLRRSLRRTSPCSYRNT